MCPQDCVKNFEPVGGDWVYSEFRKEWTGQGRAEGVRGGSSVGLEAAAQVQARGHVGADRELMMESTVRRREGWRNIAEKHW